MEIAYYPGCSLHASSRLYDVQTKLVMGRLGVDLKELEDWSCCGATSAGKIDDFMAIAMPARNLGIGEASGLSEIVIPCSACYSRMLVAQAALQTDQKLMDEINAELSKKVKGDIRIMSILEVLVPKAESRELEEKAVKKLKGLKPACYYGCMQTRFPRDVPVPDDVENPQGMEIVMKALGTDPLDWSYKTDCCGASAAVNDADTSFHLMSRIMKDAIARDVNCFITTCPMCQLNMDAYQERFCKRYGISERLPVYFITEMLGIAMDISPQQLQIDRHFVDGVKLLKELDLL
ncbi:MAG: CoB--CoM heterodisulfide reductase iron-sulfur subunit B family protein [Syntrophobacteria bacterium]